MSFELYLWCYEDGEPSGLDEDPLRAVFGEALKREDPRYSCWHLQYGGEIDSCDVFVGRSNGDRNHIKSLMVSRPIRDARLWNSLFQIMQLGNVVLLSSGGQSPLFANEQAVRHFPRDLLDALGKPVIVASGAEIRAAIEDT